MPTIWISIIGGLVRLALGGVIGYLIQEGVLKEDQVPQLVTGITLAVGGTAWIAWNKVKDRRLVNTSLALPPGWTYEGVKDLIAKEGTFAPASTPTDHIPQISYPVDDGNKNRTT
jgi:hypothetical protein